MCVVLVLVVRGVTVVVGETVVVGTTVVVLPLATGTWLFDATGALMWFPEAIGAVTGAETELPEATALPERMLLLFERTSPTCGATTTGELLTPAPFATDGFDVMLPSTWLEFRTLLELSTRPELRTWPRLRMLVVFCRRLAFRRLERFRLRTKDDVNELWLLDELVLLLVPCDVDVDAVAGAAAPATARPPATIAMVTNPVFFENMFTGFLALMPREDPGSDEHGYSRVRGVVRRRGRIRLVGVCSRPFDAPQPDIHAPERGVS